MLDKEFFGDLKGKQSGDMKMSFVYFDQASLVA